MNASIVVAICATVIAVLSLAVSVYEARATRHHDRISVRPHLALQATLHQGSRAGLQLINAGLGPAAITRTVLTLDGEPLGEFSEAKPRASRRASQRRESHARKPARSLTRRCAPATRASEFTRWIEA